MKSNVLSADASQWQNDQMRPSASVRLIRAVVGAVIIIVAAIRTRLHRPAIAWRADINGVLILLCLVFQLFPSEYRWSRRRAEQACLLPIDRSQTQELRLRAERLSGCQ
jgi:hypothetical protein